MMAIDYLLISSAYLYSPHPKVVDVLSGLGAAALIAAVVFRLRWLVLAVQGVVTAFLLVELFQSANPQVIQTSGSGTGSVLFILTLLGVAGALAWLVARALPRMLWALATRLGRPQDG